MEALAGEKSVSAGDAVLSNDQLVQSAADPVGPEVRRSNKPVLRAVLIAVAVAIAAFTAGLWIGNKWVPLGVTKMSTTGAKSDFAKSSDPVIAFWAKYIGNDPTPVIAYPDAVVSSRQLQRFVPLQARRNRLPRSSGRFTPGRAIRIESGSRRTSRPALLRKFVPGLWRTQGSRHVVEPFWPDGIQAYCQA